MLLFVKQLPASIASGNQWCMQTTKCTANIGVS